MGKGMDDANELKPLPHFLVIMALSIYFKHISTSNSFQCGLGVI